MNDIQTTAPGDDDGLSLLDIGPSDAQVAAQVAVEAIANDPSGFDDDTRRAVLANGVDAGVAPFYLDMIR